MHTPGSFILKHNDSGGGTLRLGKQELGLVLVGGVRKHAFSHGKQN